MLGWILAGAAALVLGGGGFVYWQKSKGQKDSPILPPIASRTNPPTEPKPPDAPPPPVAPTNNLRVGEITLEKTKNSSVVYAVGNVKNESDHQRFGLKVELDLLDATGGKIGTATDYLSILEPRQDWRFKALVLEAKAVSARLAAIKEDQ